MTFCDNVYECHELIPLTETKDALKEGCTICGQVVFVKKDHKGNPEPRRYAELHKKEILQPSENLYYKYHHAALSTTG